MNSIPENQASFDMPSIVGSMEWNIASDREIDGRKTTVKNATPSEEFWTAWRSAKAMLKEAGLSASKNGEGAWIVEWIADYTEEPTPSPTKETVISPLTNTDLDTVANLPPGPTDAALPSSQMGEDDSATDKIEMVSVDFFSPNEHSTALYSQSVSPALLESVANEGVKVPVRALKSGRLVDGWQRVEAAKDAGWKFVPTIFVDINPEEELQAILLYNAQRIKTMPDRLREYRAYLDIERKRAPERVGIRTDLNQGLPEGHIEFGKSHELAAKKVQLSGTSARNGLRVLEEIERRSGSGDAEAALKLLTEQGINAGWKFAYAHGWIDSAVKAKKPRPQNCEAKTQSSVTELKDDSAPSSEDTAENNSPADGWMTDDLIDDVIKDVAPTDAEAADGLRKTISYLRPHLYAVAGTTPAAITANKLRTFAKAVEALAIKYDELAANHLQTPMNHEAN